MAEESDEGKHVPGEVEKPIKLELLAPTGPIESPDRPLGLSVRVTNISDVPVWMVGVLPGSDGLRYPHYIAEIEGPSGPVQMGFPEALDYIPGLRSENFVQLAPGESFDPQGKGFIPIQQLAWFKPAEPGTYRVRLHFDATAQDPQQWMGHTAVRDRLEVESLIRKVPPVRVSSNTLEIKID